MQKSIEVEVDKHTWPRAGAGTPSFPNSFTHGVTSHQLDALSTLLLIGQLTTPPLGSGATLSGSVFEAEIVLDREVERHDRGDRPVRE